MVHVVLGSGPVGRLVARFLVGRGVEVVLVSRSGGVAGDSRVRTVALDVGDQAELLRVTAGARVIFNCLNPAYHRWAADWPPMAAAVLRAAEESGAVLATVSNLYAYGPVSGPMTADLPLAGAGVKAGVRGAMWRAAVAAHEAGRVRAVEVRAADFIGAGSQSQLGDQVIPRILAGKRPRFIVPVDQPHSFSYVPDVARTVIAAAVPEHCGRAWHVPSLPPMSLRQAAADLAGAAGRPVRSPSILGPGVQRILGIFSPLFREVPEVRYQFERPFIIDAAD
ncbi:MAG: NAD-dependent epimerase/dehydratase family protein, partial [Angustibacter sp.]